MKKILFLLALVMCVSLTKTIAQDTWQVLLNNRTVAKGDVVEGSEVTVKAKKLRDGDKYIVMYRTENSNSDWNRRFDIEDENGGSIRTITISRQSGGFYIRPDFINPIVKERKSLVIYTVSLPKDPKLAATMRPRRVLLAKISWK